MRPEAVVAREAAGRKWAAAAAALAGLLTLGGSIASLAAVPAPPRVLLPDALRDAAGEPLRSGGLRTPQVLFYDKHSGTLVAVTVALALGTLALILPLIYLYRAAQARRPQTPNVARVMAIAGPVGLAAAQVLLQAVLTRRAHDFATAADHSSQAARDVFHSGALTAGQVVGQAGVIAMGFAFVLVCLNAMRAGLLTRFMGVLGVIAGVLFVIPRIAPLPVVQTFWLLALAVLIAGRWPNGVPPAWQAGVAIPWPSQQDLRAARERASPQEEPEAPAEPRRAKQSARPHPSSKKKRRRH